MPVFKTQTALEYQCNVENKFSKGNIRDVIWKEIDGPNTQAKIQEGLGLLDQWLQEKSYASKNLRKEKLKTMDLESIIKTIFIETVQITREVPFTTVVAKLANAIDMETTRDNIVSMSEIIAVLADLDVYDLTKESPQASIMIKAREVLPQYLQKYLDNIQFLPPMVVKPVKLENNSDTGYVTVKNSVILGKWNKHNGNVCLDSLDRFNSVAMELDVEFLKEFSEPTKNYDNPEQMAQQETFIKESYALYKELIQAGNTFWFTHKVDKRGRTYCCGYHLNTQGNSFRKAICDLKKKEIVDVPDKYRV